MLPADNIVGALHHKL